MEKARKQESRGCVCTSIHTLGQEIFDSLVGLALHPLVDLLPGRFRLLLEVDDSGGRFEIFNENILEIFFQLEFLINVDPVSNVDRQVIALNKMKHTHTLRTRALKVNTFQMLTNSKNEINSACRFIEFLKRIQKFKFVCQNIFQNFEFLIEILIVT